MAEAEDDDNHAVLRTPFTSKWLVLIILSTIEEKPSLSNGDLHSILSPHGKPCALMHAILQEARKLARQDLFGDASKNAKLIFALEDELKLCGHVVKVIMTLKAKALTRMKLQMDG